MGGAGTGGSSAHSPSPASSAGQGRPPGPCWPCPSLPVAGGVSRFAPELLRRGRPPCAIIKTEKTRGVYVDHRNTPFTSSSRSSSTAPAGYPRHRLCHSGPPGPGRQARWRREGQKAPGALRQTAFGLTESYIMDTEKVRRFCKPWEAFPGERSYRSAHWSISSRPKPGTTPPAFPGAFTRLTPG